MKYVVVTGGVVSGLGKGVTISSIGRILQGCGLTVTSIKIDPYLNVDAGTMSPFEHGEVFVLNDGGEADLDLGNYERFLSIQLTSDHNITTGKIYRDVISRERRGDYLGKTVQVVPHITNQIQDWIGRVAKIPVDGSDKEPDVCLIEVGGTVGDIESMVFLEALRQFQFRVGDDNFCLLFVSLVPVLGVVGEQKTKPTQHGVKELRSLGLSPKVILCRSTEALEDATKQKISGFCHVSTDHVLSVYDVNNIYHVPLLLVQQNLHHILAKELNLLQMKEGGALPQSSLMGSPDMKEWSDMAHNVDNCKDKVQIALIGKYTGLQDSYLSVIKALKHASMKCQRDLEIVWLDATHLEEVTRDSSNGGEDGQDEKQKNHEVAWEKIKASDGVIVPGGFGNRGFVGKTLAANYCRTSNKPFLGICLGFQAMVVEYARNILQWSEANSTEFEPDAENRTFDDHQDVIFFMPEIDKTTMGGTMRLGARDTKFTHPTLPDSTTSVAKQLYHNKEIISERHRHRYEVNPKYVDDVHNAGLKFVGRDADTESRMEIAELPDHLFYIGCQYHPEFQSRPLDPSPLFLGLLLASCGGKKSLDSYLEKK